MSATALLISTDEERIEALTDILKKVFAQLCQPENETPMWEPAEPTIPLPENSPDFVKQFCSSTEKYKAYEAEFEINGLPQSSDGYLILPAVHLCMEKAGLNAWKEDAEIQSNPEATAFAQGLSDKLLQDSQEDPQEFQLRFYTAASELMESHKIFEVGSHVTKCGSRAIKHQGTHGETIWVPPPEALQITLRGVNIRPHIQKVTESMMSACAKEVYAWGHKATEADLKSLPESRPELGYYLETQRRAMQPPAMIRA